MAEQALNLSSMAPGSNHLITLLNNNDVLLGRGSGARQYIGSERFRRLVAGFKKENRFWHRNKEKDKIAKAIVSFIRSRGGRFLKRVEVDGLVKVDGNFENGAWQEVDVSVALAKCKQALLLRNQEENGSSGAANLPPFGGLQAGLLNGDNSVLGADHVAMTIALKRRQVEQKMLWLTRMLLPQHERDVLDDAYLAAANASSSESTSVSALYSLEGSRPGLDLRMQARLQQCRQMESGLLPPKYAGFVSIPHRPSLDPGLAPLNLHDRARLSGPIKKRRVDQTHFVQASQAPDIPSYTEEKEECSVVGKDDDDKLPFGGNKEPFPLILYQMLQDAEKNGQEDVLSFFPHGRTFAIHNPEMFIKDILPKYFSATCMSSFQHQLQLYGFHLVTERGGKAGYYHKFFRKGHQELVKQINYKVPAKPNLTCSVEHIEEGGHAYRQARSSASSDIAIPPSQLMVSNLSRRKDLISWRYRRTKARACKQPAGTVSNKGNCRIR